jgi:hypothetical protein
MGAWNREQAARINDMRVNAARNAGNICIGWVIDHGECLLCTLNANGVHDSGCPLRAYFLELDRARGKKVTT